MGIDGNEIIQRVCEYLDSQNWNYSTSDSFDLDFNLNNQLEECSMHIRIHTYDDSSFSIHTNTTCPLTIPAKKEDVIKEFITRANYGMLDGYFAYLQPDDDTEEGIIEYHSWLYCNDIVPSLNDVEASVDMPLLMMERYGDALFNVLQLDADPEEEIQRVEG